MNIAFIHYHLKTGGVTTVLQQQVETIKNHADVLVLTGESPENPFPAETVLIPGLGYDHPDTAAFSPQSIARAITTAIHAKWPNGCHVLHVHNPTLAKNKHFLSILKILHKDGVKLFLQIHDFAEDGRPAAYFHEDYVQNSHYGVINSRDYQILLKSGLRQKGLHKLPNMIDPPDLNPKHSDPGTHILYPVRAIRRKNIGEAILLSLFFDSDLPLLITLPPNSTADFKSYHDWKEFVKRQKLNVRFEAGIGRDFAELVWSSRFLITTSIMEGFGFSFLEPWLYGKILWGRLLPEICEDFIQNGVDLGHLYTRLMVPLAWCDKKRLMYKLEASLRQNRQYYANALHDDEIKAALHKISQGHEIDLGLLDEAFQKQVILRLIADPQNREYLVKRNPFLSNPGATEDQEVLILKNRSAILKSYNRKKYRDKLMEIYRKVSRIKVKQNISRQILLSLFFLPESFSLLKWSPYAGQTND